MRHLRWLLVPLLVIPVGWLLFTGFGRDPREVASPLIGQPGPGLDPHLPGRRDRSAAPTSPAGPTS